MTSFSNNNKFTFRFFLASISILFVLYFLNDLDVDSQYFASIYAEELAIDNSNNNNYRNEKIDFTYTVDSSEYFEEDNVPQNSNSNVNNNYTNRNSSQLTQQQYDEKKDYNQVKKEEKTLSNINNNNNKKYEFTSIESKENNNNNNNYEKSDYATFKVVINLQNIEKEGHLRVIAYINGQSFKEDIPLSQLDPSTITKKLDVKLKVLKVTELISLSPPDEFHACAYHIKDLKKEYNSILNFDCNEADVQSSDGLNTIRLFKPSSLKYNDTQDLYEQNQNKQLEPNIGESTINDETNGLDNKDNDDQVLIKVIAPLGDRKNTKQLKIAAMVRGQIQTELIKDVQKELDKNKDDTITRTFTFDRDTDIGNIQIGDLLLACVTSEDLNPPEGQECEKRLLKKFNSANSIPAR
jgi:hypothetical protein